MPESLTSAIGKPRVWPPLLAYFGLWSIAVVTGLVGVAVALINTDDPSELLRPGAAERLTVEMMTRTDFLSLSVLAMAVGGAAIALVGARLSPVPWRARLRLLPTGLSGSRAAALYGAAILGSLAVSEGLHAPIRAAGLDEGGSLAHIRRTVETASSGWFVVMVVGIGVLAPVAEELMFRGYIQTRFAQTMGRWGAIAVTAVMFGVLHADAVHTPFAAVIGVFLGWTTERAATIGPAIAAHGVNNLVSVFTTRYAELIPDLPWVPTVLGCAVMLTGAIVVVRWATRRGRDTLATGSPNSGVNY